MTCVVLTFLMLVPSASAKAIKGAQYSYDELTATGDCLRPFTLLGYIDGNKMNLRPVSPTAEVYTVVNPLARTFRHAGTVAGKTRLVGDYVELWDTDGDLIVDRILVVPRSLGITYWDADMYWLAGVGESTEPAIDDATGEALYGKEYRLPMGERQLVGYGVGSWSGVTDFSNLPDETYWPFIDYYNATSSDRLTILTGYRTSLQVTGGTCGMASALSALDWFGLRRDLNEKDLISLRQPNTRWGGFTSLAQLISVFQNLEKLHIGPAWELQSSHDDPWALFDPAWVKDTLAGGSPIMVGWNSWGAHWQVIIGYDDMGTEGTNDDVLIMMDPYDSTDQDNDGYTLQSYERLAYGVGFEDVDPSDEGEYWHTSYLVATPVDWMWEPVMGQSIPDDPTNVGDFSDDHKIPYGDAAADLALYYPDTPWVGDNGLAGAATAGYERSGDHDFSPYFKFFDWYDAESTDSLTLLEGFRTSQQVTEWTCGLASMLMVRDWFGMNDEGLTEIDMAQMRPDTTPGATLVDDLTTVIGKLNADYGEDWVYFDMRQYEAAGGWVGDLIPEVLAHGIPMMIAWDEWGGHWQVIIGYDDMGTWQSQDDVLVLTDAYDTNDHDQDGYFLESYERLIYGWTFRMGENGTFVVAYPESQFPGLDFLD
jgi:hypothetical protein